MAVSVKAYLSFESENQEIRRFSIPEDVSASYDYLVEKIKQVYPSLLRKEFKLYWRDTDGEFVVFSSDEELVMALGSSEGDNFRIYIEEIEKGTDSDGVPQEKKTKHPGVVCDVCDKEISGSRFKCLSCPDYDLCSGCESKGFHPEHQMLRIRTPAEQAWQGFLPFLAGHGRRRHSGRGCPWKQGPPRDGCGRPHRGPSGSPHCPPGRGGHCHKGRKDGGAGGFGVFGPWGSPNWWKNQSDKAQENKTENDKEDQQKDGAPNFASFQDVFDHVTQTIAEQFKMADPSDSWGSGAEGSCCKESEQKKDGDTTTNEAQNPEAAEGDTPMPASEPFVVVTDQQTEEENKSQEQAEPSASPKQRRPEEQEFERKLNEAIRQMECMGFNNDSGWLSQLLISKDFDIGKVIDTLQYRVDSK